MKEQQKISEEDKKKGWYPVLIMAGFLILLFSWIFYSHKKGKNEIDKHYANTLGVIVENNKEAHSSWNVKVKYKVNGICYAHHFSSTDWCQEGRCLGDSVKIEYSSRNPNIARIVEPDGERWYPSSKIGEQDYTVDCDKY
jgi:hypothetical protein